MSPSSLRAQDLAPGQARRPVDFSQTDLLLFDRVTRTTSIVFSAFGSDAGEPAISADGRYVAFHRAGLVLRAGTNVFLYDRLDGTLRVISDIPHPSPRNPRMRSHRPSAPTDGISPSTERRSFPSSQPAAENIFIYDRDSGTLTLVGSRRERRRSVPTDGILAIADAHSLYLFDRMTGVKTLLMESSGFLFDPQPTLSADGRFVAFLSQPDNSATPSRVFLPAACLSTTGSPKPSRK